MHDQELACRPTEQRDAESETATFFVPDWAALELLSLCTRHNARIVSVQPLAKIYGGFTVNIASSEISASELLAEWIKFTMMVEGKSERRRVREARAQRRTTPD
jgi:hypothetical protein